MSKYRHMYMYFYRFESFIKNQCLLLFLIYFAITEGLWRYIDTPLNPLLVLICIADLIVPSTDISAKKKEPYLSGVYWILCAFEI